MRGDHRRGPAVTRPAGARPPARAPPTTTTASTARPPPARRAPAAGARGARRARSGRSPARPRHDDPGQHAEHLRPPEPVLVDGADRAGDGHDADDRRQHPHREQRPAARDPPADQHHAGQGDADDQQRGPAARTARAARSSSSWTPRLPNSHSGGRPSCEVTTRQPGPQGLGTLRGPAAFAEPPTRQGRGCRRLVVSSWYSGGSHVTARTPNAATDGATRLRTACRARAVPACAPHRRDRKPHGSRRHQRQRQQRRSRRGSAPRTSPTRAAHGSAHRSPHASDQARKTSSAYGSTVMYGVPRQAQLVRPQRPHQQRTTQQRDQHEGSATAPAGVRARSRRPPRR